MRATGNEVRQYARERERAMRIARVARPARAAQRPSRASSASSASSAPSAAAKSAASADADRDDERAMAVVIAAVARERLPTRRRCEQTFLTAPHGGRRAIRRRPGDRSRARAAFRARRGARAPPARAPEPDRVGSRDVRRDVDVADDGLRDRLRTVGAKRERNDIRRSGVAEVTLVESARSAARDTNAIETSASRTRSARSTAVATSPTACPRERRARCRRRRRRR